MLAPAEHRFSVKDYYRMAETGVLRPDVRVELLNGKIIDWPVSRRFNQPTDPHLLQTFKRAVADIRPKPAPDG
jgi:hypothetical protein